MILRKRLDKRRGLFRWRVRGFEVVQMPLIPAPGIERAAYICHCDDGPDIRRDELC